MGDPSGKKHAGGDEDRAKLSATPPFKGWREEKVPGKQEENQDHSGKKKPKEETVPIRTISNAQYL